MRSSLRSSRNPPGASSRSSRPLSLLVLWIVLSLGPASTATGSPRAGKVYLTLEEALELVFGEAEVERGTIYLTDEQREQAEELAGEELPGAIVHPYTARLDGKVVGTAWIDAHRVRTLRETVLIVVDPDQRVRRVELLAFGEPEDYVPRGSWYGQFRGRRLDKDLRLGRGIRGVTGATLTARATTAAVRRALAVHRVLHGPPPEDDPDDGGPDQPDPAARRRP